MTLSHSIRRQGQSRTGRSLLLVLQALMVANTIPGRVQAQALRFSDVTYIAGVAMPTDPDGYGHGVAVADYNGDGLPDIYLVSYNTDNSLFVNNGNGTFTDRANQAGVLSGSRLDRGVAAADVDNDGDIDIYVAAGAGSNNLLYVNDGHGSFHEAAAEAGIRLNNFQGQGVSWGDYDNDGDLDLFLPSFDNGALLFRQELDRTFTEVTQAAGLVYSDQSVQAVFFDFDLDGDLDIFVSRGEGFANRFFVNHGGGTFTDEATQRNLADPDPHGQGIAIADYDGDADFDIYMSNAHGPNRLYRNEDGVFQEVAAAAGVNDHGRSLGCMFADFNNDGWPDLYVGNFGRNRIYRNLGDGTFADETDGSGADDANRAYGTTVMDYDADGYLDIFFSNSGQPSNLLRNLGTTNNHWLMISLTGTHSSRSGIGARVTVTNGQRHQVQQLVAGSSMVSGGSDLLLHFGLGHQLQADQIEVYWPSGSRDVLRNVAGDRMLNIIEDSYGVPPVDTTAPRLADIRVGDNYTGEASINWTTDEPATAQVEFGPTASYGSRTPVISKWVTAHAVKLKGLISEELYHFRVISKDSLGNTAASEDLTFTAAPIPFPPPIRSVHVQAINPRGAELGWSTYAASICTVRYGVTDEYTSHMPALSAHGRQHRAVLSGLTPNTTYHFRITAHDAERRLTRSRDYTFVTPIEPDTVPPLISNLAWRELSHNSVIIVWDTDEAATALVEFGLTSDYGQSAARDSVLRSHHEIQLAGLAADTSYHFRVASRDSAGNAAVSRDSIFHTLPEPDIRPPVLSNVTARDVEIHSAHILWDTDEAATSLVEYGTSMEYGQSAGNDDFKNQHEVVLANLSANTAYHFRVRSRDAAGNSAVSDDFVFQTLPQRDTTPPRLSDIEARNISTNRAFIIWNTDEEATTRVEYGTDANYGEVAAHDALVTHHEIELAGLSSNTTYHFRVLSTDAAGNQAVSGDFTFTTERNGGGSPHTITDDFNRSGIGPGWTLDDRFWEIRNGELGHSSQATGSWRYLAVFNRVSNGSGRRITEVSYRWGRNVDDIGVREGAMALMLDSDSPRASGYWIWHRYNQVWLWTIVNGEYVGGIDLGHWNGSSDPVAGDVVTVVIYEESDANYFDYYINGRFSATAVDPEKHFPRSETWYTGVFMRGEGVRNECDDFSVTYMQSNAQAAPMIFGIRAAEIGRASAKISWNTETALAAKVEYRLSEEAHWLSAANGAPATSHSSLLTGLLPNRSYRYRIVTAAGDKNMAVSEEYQFVTQPDNGDIANNVELLSFLPLRGDPTLANVWGYADASGEYALVCMRQKGLAIVEVTEARRPQHVASVTSFYNDLKDVKVYDHYAVAINEFGPLQIIDLANPRAPELAATYQESFSGGHNLFIEGHYAYVVGTHPMDPKQDDPTGLHILDLSEPGRPTLAGKREGFYIHDLYVENDTAYVLGLHTDRVHIWDVRDKKNILEIAAFSYHAPHSVRRGYDKQTLLLSDEGRGQDVQFWHAGDLKNIRRAGSYMTDPQIAPHCIETIGPLAFIAYFEDMLRIVDYGHPSSPVEVGFYDTYPNNPSHGQPPGAHQTAAWGVYPHTPSGNIYLSDMSKGLYVFRYVPPGPASSYKSSRTGKPAGAGEILAAGKTAQAMQAATPALPQQFGLASYPNPFRATQGTRIRLQLPEAAQIQLTVFDVMGRAVKELAGGIHSAGSHELQWRGDNQAGDGQAQELYLLRLRYRRASEQSWTQLTQRVLLLH